MIKDEEGMPHDFCTTYRTFELPLSGSSRMSDLLTWYVDNSYKVAEKVKDWVDEIIRAHKKVIS